MIVAAIVAATLAVTIAATIAPTGCGDDRPVYTPYYWFVLEGSLMRSKQQIYRKGRRYTEGAEVQYDEYIRLAEDRKLDKDDIPTF